MTCGIWDTMNIGDVAARFSAAYHARTSHSKIGKGSSLGTFNDLWLILGMPNNFFSRKQQDHELKMMTGLKLPFPEI